MIMIIKERWRTSSSQPLGQGPIGPKTPRFMGNNRRYKNGKRAKALL
jgi:hypothetical protein